jgi:hypothetical protein
VDNLIKINAKINNTQKSTEIFSMGTVQSFAMYGIYIAMYGIYSDIHGSVIQDIIYENDQQDATV